MMRMGQPFDCPICISAWLFSNEIAQITHESPAPGDVIHPLYCYNDKKQECGVTYGCFILTII